MQDSILQLVDATVAVPVHAFIIEENQQDNFVLWKTHHHYHHHHVLLTRSL
jgi:hypothetical protein